MLYGYESVSIGSADLPVSVMLSGFIMFAWYWFTVIYVQESVRIENRTSRTFFDAALGLLILTSFGAWGIAVFQSFGPEVNRFRHC